MKNRYSNLPPINRSLFRFISSIEFLIDDVYIGDCLHGEVIIARVVYCHCYLVEVFAFHMEMDGNKCSMC